MVPPFVFAPGAAPDSSVEPPSIPIGSIARAASGESGTVRPGTSWGENATTRPRTSSSTAMPRLATAFQGTSFSIAIRAAMNAIQPTLITPSANRAAISAQQHPTHQPPCSMPIRRPPSRPGFHACITNMSGFRHLVRHASLSGVSW